MKIKKLSVKKLWNKYTFSIDFDKDITILIGKNGSGKSTILNIVYLLLQQDKERKIPYDFDELSLQFDTNKITAVERKRIDFNEEVENLDNLNEEKLKTFLNKLQKELSSKMKEENNRNINLQDTIPDNKTLSKENLNYLLLSTFDMEAKDKELVHKHYEKSYINTELDVLLNDLITKFKLYLLKLKEKVEIVQKEFDSELEKYTSNKELKELKKKLLGKKQVIDNIYKDRDFFKNKLNELFLDTNKTIQLDENNSIIFNLNEKEKLTPYQLSSGEKQILIIMLNVMLLENKPTILLMDEPEISLHVEWQRVFIKTLLELNSNLQLIIATHSPAIVSKGYRNKVVSLNNFNVKD